MAQKILELNDDTFAQMIEKGVALVDFWAPWCGPCRVQGPIVEQVAEKVGDHVTVAKLNVDENAQAATTHEVRGIPTLIVFKDGEPVQRFVGVQEKAVLIAALEAAQK